jgi:hypothetical protein
LRLHWRAEAQHQENGKVKPAIEIEAPAHDSRQPKQNRIVVHGFDWPWIHRVNTGVARIGGSRPQNQKRLQRTKYGQLAAIVVNKIVLQMDCGRDE